MNQSTLPDKMTWTIPKAYLQAERDKVVAEYRPVVWKWAAAALISGLVGVALLWFVRGIVGSLGICLAIAAVLVLVYVYAVQLGKRITQLDFDQVVLTAKGPLGGTWSKVHWYAITDVEDVPDLRALELGYTDYGRRTSSFLPFNPAEVDEAQLIAFLEHYAPGKRRQD